MTTNAIKRTDDPGLTCEEHMIEGRWRKLYGAWFVEVDRADVTGDVRGMRIRVVKRNGQRQTFEADGFDPDTAESEGESPYPTGHVIKEDPTVAKPARNRSTSRPSASGSRHRCQECGRLGAHRAYDMSGIPGYACNCCDDGTLSFA